MKRPPSSWSVNTNPTLRLQEKTLYDHFPKEPSHIGVGFNIELFHPEIPREWIRRIIAVIEVRGQDHMFIFLTKFPERYAEFDFPKNCWLGVTVTNQYDRNYRTVEFFKATKGKENLLFVSLEPYLEDMSAWGFNFADISWLIIGALTGPKAKEYRPKREWIKRHVEEYRIAGKPIFLKDNIASIWGDKLIQEMPE